MPSSRRGRPLLGRFVAIAITQAERNQLDTASRNNDRSKITTPRESKITKDYIFVKRRPTLSIQRPMETDNISQSIKLAKLGAPIMAVWLRQARNAYWVGQIL